jgi:hypothetical protein
VPVCAGSSRWRCAAWRSCSPWSLAMSSAGAGGLDTRGRAALGTTTPPVGPAGVQPKIIPWVVVGR